MDLLLRAVQDDRIEILFESETLWVSNANSP